MEQKPKKFYRSKKEKMVAGVCGGLGEYFDVDPLLLRIVFVALTFVSGVGIILYIILAILIPQEPGEEVSVEKKERVKEFAEEVAKGAQSVAGEMAKGAKSLAGEIKENQGWLSDKRNTLALFIILIGFLALLDQLSPELFSWDVLWPIIIILIGIFIIVRKK